MEKHYRQSVKEKISRFQAIEWHTADEQLEEGKPEQYIIRCFGVTEEGYSVCCTITEFNPFFYLKVPKFWKKAHISEYISKLQSEKINDKNVINYYQKNSLIPEKCCFEYKKDFYGFHNEEEFKFLKLVFHSQKGMKCYLYGIKKINDPSHKTKIDRLHMYETNIDPLLRFYHIRNIQPSNWLNIKKCFIQEEESSTCQINIECYWQDVFFLEKEGNAPLLQASYDIETYSSPGLNERGEQYYPFPIPEKQDNVIYQIATCFKRVNSNDFLVKHILTLKKCEAIEDPSIVVWECSDEKDLLLKWKKLIELMDPDILYQYNGDMFDCNYMNVRSKMLGISGRFYEVSRLIDYPAELKESSFSSSAYGNSEYKRLTIPGRINFDILIYIKREFKENSYKLDNVSEKYLGEKKNDVKVQEIFKAYETGNPRDILKIAKYCIQDTLLPQKLVDTLHILQTQISMSNVTFVPIKYLIERGQQVKALSQISKKSNEKGYLMPNFDYSLQDKFVGATVLSPLKGIWGAVTVVDFASLYPSIMRAHNLCYTTIVIDKSYLNLPDVEYLNVEIEEGKTATFAQKTDSILPDLLADLAVQRKKYKKLMGSSEDPSIKEIYNRTQLAYKVSMNSIYGIVGSDAMGIKAIAASVTKIGREMIHQTKEFIENNHHQTFPEGHKTDELDSDELVIIKGIYEEDSSSREVKVSDLEKHKDILIKTTDGWRKFESAFLI